MMGGIGEIGLIGVAFFAGIMVGVNYFLDWRIARQLKELNNKLVEHNALAEKNNLTIDRFTAFSVRDTEIMKQFVTAIHSANLEEAERLIYVRTKNFEGWVNQE